MRRFLSPLLLAALALLDVVLVAVALRPSNPSGGAGATAPATSDAVSSPTSTSSAAPSQSAKITRVLAAATDATHGWRVATGGHCEPGGPALDVARTTDGGKKWQSGSTSLATVSAASADSKGVVLMGLDAKNCSPKTVRLSEQFKESSGSAPAWAIDPRNQLQLLHKGEKTTAAPCSVALTDVAPVSDQEVTVLCDDGTIRGTRDAGVHWTTRKTVKDAVAIASQDDGAVQVAVRTDCGLRVATIADIGDEGKCVAGSTASSGPVDLTIAGTSAWLVDQFHQWITAVAAPAPSSSTAAPSSSSVEQPQQSSSAPAYTPPVSSYSAPQPSYTQPSYTQPSYTQPSYPQPSYTQPSYSQPAPSYTQPYPSASSSAQYPQAN